MAGVPGLRAACAWLGLDVAPFTLDAAADVRAAAAAKVDALITDDPLMAARALGLRPLRLFDAGAFIDGRRLFAEGHMRIPSSVPASRGCRGRVTMRVMTPKGRVVKTVRGRVLAGCEFRFQHTPHPAAARRAARDHPLRGQHGAPAPARRPRARRAAAAQLPALTGNTAAALRCA